MPSAMRTLLMDKRIHNRRGRLRWQASAGSQRRLSKRHWIPSPLSRGLKAAGMTAYREPFARASILLGFGVPAIAHAVHGVDAVERWVEDKKFSADALDVRGDGGIVDDDLCVAHQTVAILDVTRKPSQRVDHPELGQREIHALAIPLRREALEIELQLAALDRFLDLLRRREQVAASE